MLIWNFSITVGICTITASGMCPFNFPKSISILLIALLLSSCSPSVVDLSLYTTDIEIAQEGEVILLMGAGDVWQWGRDILEALK